MNALPAVRPAAPENQPTPGNTAPKAPKRYARRALAALAIGLSLIGAPRLLPAQEETPKVDLKAKFLETYLADSKSCLSFSGYDGARMGVNVEDQIEAHGDTLTVYSTDRREKDSRPYWVIDRETETRFPLDDTTRIVLGALHFTLDSRQELVPSDPGTNIALRIICPEQY